MPVSLDNVVKRPEYPAAITQAIARVDAGETTCIWFDGTTVSVGPKRPNASAVMVEQFDANPRQGGLF